MAKRPGKVLSAPPQADRSGNGLSWEMAKGRRRVTGRRVVGSMDVNTELSVADDAKAATVSRATRAVQAFASCLVLVHAYSLGYNLLSNTSNSVFR